MLALPSKTIRRWMKRLTRPRLSEFRRLARNSIPGASPARLNPRSPGKNQIRNFCCGAGIASGPRDGARRHGCPARHHRGPKATARDLCAAGGCGRHPPDLLKLPAEDQSAESVSAANFGRQTSSVANFFIDGLLCRSFRRRMIDSCASRKFGSSLFAGTTRRRAESSIGNA
jgi:hypothetical protein